MKKDCYFKIVAGILPIVLILLLEGGLRLLVLGTIFLYLFKTGNRIICCI